ncbi:MAG: hypothetical protein IKX00_02645 [Bacilli bacterium]|nr:hypothetical protein [Bacilli bacterium]
MKKLTLKYIDEMPEDIVNYLLTLPGMKRVIKSKDDENAIIFDFEYEDEVLKPKFILEEIELYFKNGRPMMVYFDKHMDNIKTIRVDKPKICCEFCFLNCLYELFYDDNVNSFYSKRDSIYDIEKQADYFEITYNKDDINIKAVIDKYTS